MIEQFMGGVEAISWLVIMFFLVLYMLIDGPDHLKALRSLLPKRSRLEATNLFRDIAKAHRGWALASMANVASATTLIGTGLFFLGVPGAYLLGFLAGLGELIPNIGPILGAMPALIFTLVAQPEKFFWVLGMFVVLQTIQSWTISPQMLKFSVELPVLVTILSVLVFGILFGFLGVLVAIPLVTDMVVVWHLISRRIEKDTTEYDVVNTAPLVRLPMSPDNTPPSRLRKMFRRYRDEAAVARKGEATVVGPEDGIEKLQEVERQSREDNRNLKGEPPKSS
jgi:predicted PurR-regulated permease PerM